jgi:hypothetical protein
MHVLLGELGQRQKYICISGTTKVQKARVRVVKYFAFVLNALEKFKSEVKGAVVPVIKLDLKKIKLEVEDKLWRFCNNSGQRIWRL